MCYSVLQCVAVCCSVLQCVAVCCSVLHCQQDLLPPRFDPRFHLQCVAVCYIALQCIAVCYGELYCVAVCCSVLQCVAVWYIANETCSQHASILASTCSVLQCVALRCSVLQCVAVRCSVLECVAVCGSVWQCVALRCRVLQCVAGCYIANETCSHHASICASTCSSRMSYTCYISHEPMVRDIHYKCMTWEGVYDLYSRTL